MRFYLVLVVVIFCSSLKNIECKFNLKKLLKNFDDLLGDEQKEKETPKNLKNFKFSFQNCGPANDPFRVNNLTVSPDPLDLPGNLTFGGEAVITSDITAPLIMTLKLIKIVGPFKVEIPCIDNFGSCTYSDVCSMLPGPSDCPPFFIEHKIPCDCPFPKGDYSASNVQVELDLPTKVPPGEYNILANFQNKQLGHVGCVQIDLKVAS